MRSEKLKKQQPFPELDNVGYKKDLLKLMTKVKF